MNFFRKTPLDSFLILYAVIAMVLPFVIAAFFDYVILWVALAPMQAIFLVTIMNTSMHHHMHVPIFNSKILNRTYELFISAVTGIPFQGWKTFHTIHHKYNNDSIVNGKTYDPLSFYRYGKNGERENFWLYTVKGFWRDITGITILDKEDNCRTPIKINKPTEFRNEKIAFYCFLILIAFVNPTYAIFYVVCVYILSLILNNANSYGEHFGPVEQSNFRANSVGNYNKLYNFLCFNSGLHQEHHVRPSAHWTELPKITKTLPTNRHTINTMYMFNAPWFKDLVALLKGKK